MCKRVDHGISPGVFIGRMSYAETEKIFYDLLLRIGCIHMDFAGNTSFDSYNGSNSGIRLLTIGLRLDSSNRTSVELKSVELIIRLLQTMVGSKISS